MNVSETIRLEFGQMIYFNEAHGTGNWNPRFEEKKVWKQTEEEHKHNRIHMDKPRVRCSMFRSFDVAWDLVFDLMTINDIIMVTFMSSCLR